MSDVEPKWPDLTRERQAYEQAKRELPSASVSEIARRAQEIKIKLGETKQ